MPDRLVTVTGVLKKKALAWQKTSIETINILLKERVTRTTFGNKHTGAE